MFTIPAPFKNRSEVSDLKERLDWGEPALTIIDVRDREAFNQSHITGAVSLPMDELVNRALNNFELIRDIYIYGATEKETALGVTKLRLAGYKKVAELVGGLNAWKASGYPVEG
ncbi:unknown [Crocosphaera subtropica ATCC 51142]|uniref:Rhodanese domain-containing protein n=1 Tax=Crocosphaera subtropica (strain ATCC 51142 / BH68) TaxID=43989 RepID=B1WT65_CROS5|nr:rhodanese-like domain-containing protein [Crocosphaera subtropica]ACB51987.1 unknown [Crocosphaera subtropica ATCC 51142]